MSKGMDETINTVRQAFREFYYNNYNLIEAPNAIEEREFGYSKFDGTMVRHLAFKSINELIALLIREVPADVYCSSAYYSYPTRAMQEKSMKGADLIFDIDIKELKPQCAERHDVYLCSICKSSLKGNSVCYRCNSSSIKHIPIPCNECINLGKSEVRKLLNILEDDFAIDSSNKDEVCVYFSGNNGFHVHIKGRYTNLNSNARAEVVNYLSAKGLVYDILFKSKRGKEVRIVKEGSYKDKDNKNTNHASNIKLLLNPDGHGWVGRVSRYILNNRRGKSRYINNNNYYADANAIEDALLKLSVRIDPNVTIDMHRIFRLAGTLNSKSSLAKVICNDLNSFNPFNDACFIGDREVNAYIIKAPRFTLKGNTFGPFMEEHAKIPLYAFCYLACKGLASIVTNE
jgi:DNA primase small subunit